MKTVAAFLLAALAAGALGAAAPPRPAPPAAAAADRPEPGLQGQTMPGEAHVLDHPYQRGVELVGHLDLQRPGNLMLTRAGRCAYVSSMPPVPIPGFNTTVPRDHAGVAVIDVRDPAHPQLVRLLRDRGSLDSGETMATVDIPGRHILIAGLYAGGKSGRPDDRAWLSIYDVSDCRNPRLLSEFAWPENSHMVALSPDGRRAYGTVISPFDGRGGLQVLDLSDASHPRFVGKFPATRPDGTNFEFAPHDISFSPDERRIYAGVIASQGGDLNVGVPLMPPSMRELGNEGGGIYIFDNSDIVDRRPNPRLRLIGTALHAGWHSPTPARLGGRPFLVSNAELGACPGTWPRFTDIADQRHPQVVGEFRLAMNQAENCGARGPIASATGGIAGDPGTASMHFATVDSATDTHLGLFGFMWAGLRIVDIRDPRHPTEVAYYKPGDACMSEIRYLAATGEIWLACTESGFHVLRLQPAVRRAVGLR